MFATHWSPNGSNEVTTVCDHCRRILGRTMMPGEPWRSYTRVVIAVRTPQAYISDVSHWCPECWATEGQATKLREFPEAEFTEIPVT